MLDIGVVIQAPMEDKDWLKKCALMGLLTCALFLVPIVGAIVGGLNIGGWMRTYADARLRGEKELPAVGLGYIGAGWRLAVSFFPIVGLALVVVVVLAGVAIAGAAAKLEVLSMVSAGVGALLLVPFMLWMFVFQPAMVFLHIVGGERWASKKFGEQWRLMTTTGTNYLLLWVAFLVCGVIMEIGALALIVGLIVSFPYGYAMQGAAIAEFARITKKVA